ncbi:MAG: leukotoxin LktA family filamentous adhesin, partial [Cyanobacteriota bacterium]
MKHLKYIDILIILVFLFIFNLPTYGQQIIIDGKTDTKLNVNGNSTDITTSTIRNNNAFNSFQRFNVNQNNTVNLIVPGEAQNLINVIHTERSFINGTLNSLKNNIIGGNVYLINPYGITVGAQGIINVGSLTAITPTKQFSDSIFDPQGQINDSSISIILNGNTPINDASSIEVQGKINAIKTVTLDTGTFSNSGQINSGVKFTNNIETEDIINSDNIETEPQVNVKTDGIYITTTQNFYNDGILASGTNNNSDISNINIKSNANIDLNSSSTVSSLAEKNNVIIEGNSLQVSGTILATGSSGGNIDITGNSINVSSATIDASGQENGGRIRIGGEFQGGKNLVIDEIPNARTLTIDEKSNIIASSTGNYGNGGTIILWADDNTKVLGNLDSKPGSLSGAGGFIEVSSGDNLFFNGSAISGIKDRKGTFLLDPKNIFISALGIADIANNDQYGENSGSDVTLSNDVIASLLSNPQDVVLQANNDIHLNDPIITNNPLGDGGDLTLQAGRTILINKNIDTDNGNLNIYANDILANGVVDGKRDAGPANITMTAMIYLNAGSGAIDIQLRDGAGKTFTESGDIMVNSLYGSTINVQNNGPTAGSDVFVWGGSVISSRDILNKLGGDHLIDNSVGNSGTINIEGETITVEADAQILSFANNGFTSGDTKLIANDFVIDPIGANTNINAGDNVILSRKTAGDFLNNITPDEAYQFTASNFYFGNHSSSNYLANQVEFNNGLTYDFINNSSITNVFITGKLLAAIDSSTDFLIPGNLTIFANDPGSRAEAFLASSNTTVNGDINLSIVTGGPIWGGAYITGGVINVGGSININSTGNDNAYTEAFIDGGVILNTNGNIDVIASANGDCSAYIDTATVNTSLNDINISSTSITGDSYSWIDTATLNNINKLSIDSNSNNNTADTSIIASNITTLGDINITSNAAGAGNAATYITNGSTITTYGNLRLLANDALNTATAHISDGTGITTINTGSHTRRLIVTAVNTIDPSSNIYASINGGNINVDDIDTCSIFINADTVTGDADINLVKGNSNVTISNNSLNTLLINNIDSQINGKFMVNDIDVTAGHDSFNIVSTNNTSNTYVDVVNNTISDIILQETIHNSAYIIDINNSDGNILSDGSQLLDGYEILLYANRGAIGTIVDNVDVKPSYKVISSSKYNTYLKASTGDLNIYSNSASMGSLYFTSDNGNIKDRSPGGAACVTGINATFDAPNGFVGGTSYTIGLDILGTLNGSAAGSFIVDQINGNLTISSISAGSILIKNTSLLPNGNITIGSGGSLIASGSGNSIVLTSTNGAFNNAAGAGALQAPAGRWLVYTSNPTDTNEGLLTYNKLYNTTYALNPPGSIPAGDYMLYRIAPFLTVTADTQTKLYGDSNPTLTYAITGFIDGDTLLTSLTGTPSLSTTSNTTSPVGLYPINTSTGSLSSSLGYQFNLVDNSLTIDPAPLSINANNTSKIYGDANPAFSSTFTGLKAGDLPADYTVSYSTPATIASNIGNYSITPSGVVDSNYNITFNNGILTIDPA